MLNLPSRGGKTKESSEWTEMSDRADSAGISGCLSGESQPLSGHGNPSGNAAPAVDAYAVDNLVASWPAACAGHLVTGGMTVARWPEG
jgi:hypothetical protein